MNIGISADLVGAIIAYLETKPYREVHKHVDALRRGVPAADKADLIVLPTDVLQAVTDYLHHQCIHADVYLLIQQIVKQTPVPTNNNQQ